MRTFLARRRARRWWSWCLLTTLLATLPACTWLESEFSSIERLPPSCRAGADAPPTALAERP